MKIYALLAVWFFPLFLSGQDVDPEDYDLWIKNARVIDGSGQPEYVADILVLGDEIAKIAPDNDRKYKAKEEIDALGLVLTPGFIDTHSHGDPMKTPAFHNFLAMGVTSISLGQDGSSPRHRDLSTWMAQVEEEKLGVNIVMFAGHNTLRELSGVNYDTLPEEKGLLAMEALLQSAMDAGVFGMTTGLEYHPGAFSRSEELERLAKIVGKNRGILMSHIRNEDDSEVENSIRELLFQGRFSPVHVSHIKSVYGKGEERAEEILDLLDSARKAGVKVTADIYPYNASYTGIAIVFPEWAKKPHDFGEVVKSRRDELAEFLRNKIEQRNGPQATLIGSGSHKGKSLKQISEVLNKPFEDVLIDEIGPYGAGGAYFIMDEDLQERLMLDKNINIASDGSPGMSHPRGYGSFAKIIEKYVNKEQLFSLKEAVHKMSGLAAETIGLRDRGLIKEGFKADLLLFDPAEIKQTATYEEPHRLAEGFKFVLVNGKIAKKNNDFSGNRNGRMLKRNE